MRRMHFAALSVLLASSLVPQAANACNSGENQRFVLAVVSSQTTISPLSASNAAGLVLQVPLVKYSVQTYIDPTLTDDTWCGDLQDGNFTTDTDYYQTPNNYIFYPGLAIIANPQGSPPLSFVQLYSRSTKMTIGGLIKSVTQSSNGGNFLSCKVTTAAGVVSWAYKFTICTKP